MLENDLFQDAAWIRKVGSVKGTCCDPAFALVLQLFYDGLAPKWPKERQQEDGGKTQSQPEKRHHFKPSGPPGAGFGKGLGHRKLEVRSMHAACFGLFS
jgi:hypothetical protein